LGSFKPVGGFACANTVSASRRLATEAEALTNLLGRFRMSDDRGVAPARPRRDRAA
jgi:hypothetical protein